uniref:Membrane-associated tyrosine- and threonine-specific cdc2-inhibitory kinase n=1 Tax=Phallusia mammillata TaxID=59560 RepID=A0A6F9DPK2_9ASCI|nr:membrane-associated tyrosine- and threonine-specific cdc2-inhibitory kinase-like [Phallusia mammillata]
MYNMVTPGKHVLFDNRNPLASSTPSEKLNRSRPLPKFIQNDKHHLFHFKKIQPGIDKALQPRSPVKSAPPVSRVFPHRSWAPEKAHAVSFRVADEPTGNSTMFSRFYNSDSSELYFEQCFIIEKKIGEGSFGEVMQVRSRDNSERCAVKRSREKFRSEADRKRKLDEVKKHEQLPSHPNCVKFIKAWEEKHRLYIQTELCRMSLQSYMEAQQSIPIQLIWKYFIDLLKGLYHIHSHGFIHFDVKPANIFVTENGSCKIGDYGLVVDRSSDDIDDAREGDNKYMAPELLEGVFSDKADVFSLGIAILEISCNLDLPSSGLSWQLLRQGYIPPECASKMPTDLCAMVRWLMTPDYKERPSVGQVLQHPVVLAYKQKLVPLNFFHQRFEALHRVICMLICFCLSFLAIPWEYCRKKISLPRAVSDKSIHQDLKAWDSSNSTVSSIEGDYINDLLEHVDHNRSNMFLTPDVHNRSYSCFTPTPRNSSPLANRAPRPNQDSPDISPLSHSKHRVAKKASMAQSMSDDFEFFLSDNSENEHSSDTDEAYREKLICSKPRNLLDMLNEVSDSDTSNTG